MHIDCCNVLTEKNPGKVFTIADWSMEIYHVVLSGTGKESDMKLE
jgi:hypothetical protein